MGDGTHGSRREGQRALLRHLALAGPLTASEVAHRTGQRDTQVRQRLDLLSTHDQVAKNQDARGRNVYSATAVGLQLLADAPVKVTPQMTLVLVADPVPDFVAKELADQLAAHPQPHVLETYGASRWIVLCQGEGAGRRLADALNTAAGPREVVATVILIDRPARLEEFARMRSL